MSEKRYDDDQLLIGILTEMEHARNGDEAYRLALRNLQQDAGYYKFFERKKYRQSGQPARYAQARAPKPDGVTINGRWYKPGQFIPGHALAQASPMQLRQIETGVSAQDPTKPRPATEKPQIQDVKLGIRWPWAASPEDLQQRLAAQGILKHARISARGDQIVIESRGHNPIIVRYAQGDELEQAYRQQPGAAAESAQAGFGVHHDQMTPIAMYSNGVITLDPDFTDAELNHELVHALRDLGVISDRDIAPFGSEEKLAYGYQRWVHAGRPGSHGLFARIAGFFGALLGHGGRQARQQQQVLRKIDSGALLESIEQDRKSRLIFKAAAAAVGANIAVGWMQNALLPVMRGSITPGVPETGMRSNGVINCASIHFATRNWEEWFQDFAGDTEMAKAYAAGDWDGFLRSLFNGLKATAAIFGNFTLPDELVGNPIRDNNDPLFEKTFDVSTVCPQQDMYVDAILELQRRHNKVFDKYERFLIGQMLAEEGAIPTCWYCYGQSSRNNGGQTCLNGRDIWEQVRAAHHDGRYDQMAAGTVQDVSKVWQKLQAAQANPRAAHRLIKSASDTYGKTLAKYLGEQWQRPDAQALWAGGIQRLEQLATGRVAPDNPHEQAAQEALWETLGKVHERDLKKLFKSTREGTNPWSVSGDFAKYVAQYAHNPEAHDLWTNRLPHVHDIAMGYAEPQTPVEEATRAAIKRSMITVNLPKGWASYNKQLLKMDPESVRKFNNSAGFRLNSQTDFRPWHAIEVAQFLTHLGSLGGMAHAYTRKPEFVELFGNSGLKFNLSCSYAQDTSGRIQRDRFGTPMWDMSSFGQDGYFRNGQWVSHQDCGKELALELRKKNPNVGTMLVPTTVEGLLAGLDDQHIDMIIPYHAGAVPKSVDAFQGAYDFSKYQHEHWNRTGRSKEVKRARMHEVKLGDGRVAWTGDKVTVQVLGKPVTVTVGGSITREHHGDNKQQYLALCEALGCTPRFPQLCGRWQVPPQPAPVMTKTGKLAKNQPKGPDEFERVSIDHPNYMRLVKDVARTDTPQQVVNPAGIDWDAVNQHLEAYMQRRGRQSQLGKNPYIIDALDQRIRAGLWPKSQTVPTAQGPFLPAGNLTSLPQPK